MPIHAVRTSLRGERAVPHDLSVCAAVVLILLSGARSGAATQAGIDHGGKVHMFEESFDHAHLTTMAAHGVLRKVWGSVGNGKLAVDGQTKDPSEWHFFHYPLLQPSFSSYTTGGQVQSEIVASMGRLPEVHVRVLLHTPASRRAAWTSVQEVLDEAVRYGVHPHHVEVLPVTHIHLSDKGLPWGVSLVTRSEFVEQAEAFTVRFSCETLQLCKTFVNTTLRHVELAYVATFRGVALNTNKKSIAMSDLRHTQLYKQLDGVSPGGGGTVYVHRDDLQQLGDSLKQELIMTAYSEEPAAASTFSMDVRSMLLTMFTDKAAAAAFDQAKWEHTYHADDLRPDVLTREINKRIDVDEGSGMVRVNVQNSGQGKVSLGLPDIMGLSLGGSGSHSHSKEEVQSHLRRHDIDAVWEGAKVVVKDVKLVAVNMAEFSSAKAFVEQSITSSKSLVPRRGTIYFSVAGDEDEPIPDPPCYYGPWTTFGTCSEPCGEYGVQTSTRKLLSTYRCQADPEGLERTRACNRRACDCEYGEWGEWSRCSKACGGGTQTKKRTTLTKYKCDGAGHEMTRDCNTKPCLGCTQVSTSASTPVFAALSQSRYFQDKWRPMTVIIKNKLAGAKLSFRRTWFDSGRQHTSPTDVPACSESAFAVVNKDGSLWTGVTGCLSFSINYKSEEYKWGLTSPNRDKQLLLGGCFANPNSGSRKSHVGVYDLRYSPSWKSMYDATSADTVRRSDFDHKVTSWVEFHKPTRQHAVVIVVEPAA